MKDIYIVASDHVVLYCCGRAGGGGTRAGLETGGAAGAGSPLYSNEWNQMLRTDGARRSETGYMLYGGLCVKFNHLRVIFIMD